MKIVFMGTPDFAVSSLNALIHSSHQICAVFTQPDRPQGRGHQLKAPPVKELAAENGIPVYQPATLKDDNILALLADIAPDVIVVVAYGRILPKSVLDIPVYGCVNVHGSLLPKYRGAAPVQWAVINGEKTSGVTTMFMGEGIDTGDILLKSEVSVGEEETSGELFDRLKLLGAELLLTTLNGIETGTIERIPQNDADATFAPMLTREMADVDWFLPARQIHDLIRGLNPWPTAFTSIDGKKIKIYSSRVIDSLGKDPGTLVNVSDGLAVCCGEGALLLKEIQPENGKRMDSKSYLLGHPLQEDMKCG